MHVGRIDRVHGTFGVESIVRTRKCVLVNKYVSQIFYRERTKVFLRLKKPKRPPGKIHVPTAYCL